ncbi:MAG: CoA transferase [Chloroflexi bacterium]|nr:CoA transferase [Chloroflexota bacterium]
MSAIDYAPSKSGIYQRCVLQAESEMRYDGALSDLRVLDFTHYIAGPYTTKLLADYGADVLKVERPEIGDGARRMGPFPGDVPHIEKSGTFLHLNTNKRSITLNLKSQQAQDIIKRLVKNVDVVVESFRPGQMAAYGLDYAALRAINPQIVVTSISNFGQTGPYRDFRSSDLMIYGMGGEMYSTGLEDREPLKLGENVVLYQAGAIAATATMGAVFAIGSQHVDVSLMETQVGTIDRRMSMLLAYQYNGEISKRSATATAGGYPNGVFICQDGYVQIAGGRNYFDRVVAMMGAPDELLDERWYAPEAQYDPELKDEFSAYFIPWCLERTKREIWQAAQEAGVLSAPINAASDLINDTGIQSRGAFAEIDHPAAGSLLYPGRPFIMQESPWSVRRPAPLLGEHTEEVLTALGYAKDDIEQLRRQGVI